MDDNEMHVQELDEEFKYGLVAIRPYIERLASIEDARLCRQWLDSFLAGTYERVERNKLLHELIKHVKSGILKHPFTLASTATPYMEVDIMDNRNTYFEPEYSRVEGQFYGDSCKESESKDTYTNSPLQSTPESSLKLPRRRPERRYSEPAARNWTEKHEDYFTEPCAENVCGGCEDYINSMRNSISTLRAKNEALVNEVRLYQKSSRAAQEDLNKVNEEVISLKTKLRELQKINSNFEKNHNNALNEYKKSLTETLSQIMERLEEFSDQKLDLSKIVASLESKLKNQCNHQSKECDSKLQKEIEELKTQLLSQRTKHQNEIKRLELIIKKKNEELKSMEQQVQKECSQMQKEVSHIKSEIDQVTSEGHLQLKAKIKSLSQDVSRLEKANKQLVIEYEQRLSDCKSEQEKKEQLLLENSTKNVEMSKLEKTVIELEQRYRKIVSEGEARAANQRRRDIQRIKELEEQLLQINAGNFVKSGNKFKL